ncbi:warA [Symbiodinium natans]|uniref:WarA protein n=1 Tax=Symbiodinium natans TaxID=878477 RepID=A0A812J731_9DINO|nr:warA [Symbiodinium natans]
MTISSISSTVKGAKIWLIDITDDVDLVFSLLGEMRCRVSLALAFTVRSLSIADCKDLVEAKADLTIADGRGYTPLHNAVRFRNVEAVRFLLQNGARQGLRDKLGNTSLHVIPLYADETTLQLCQELGEDAAYLQKKNRAGLQVLQRLEAWALTAVNGGPYKPVLDWIQLQKQEHPFLAEKGKDGKKRIRSDRFQVSTHSTHVVVREQERTVHVVEPEFTPLCHVVYVGLPRFIPFSLQLPALQRWAGGLGVKVWAICEDSVDPGLMKDEDPKAFTSDLALIVEGLLPSLPEKFVLVDSSWGPGTSLVWKFKERLQGAMIINTHLFKAPDFDDTEAAWKIKTRMAQLGDLFERREMENILKVLPDFMYPTGGADGVEATKKTYAAAVSSASEKFWKLSALQPSWNFNHLTPILSSQSEWHMDSLPVVLACSDQAPLVVVGESMQRLNHLMPGSKLEFIPSSKWSWQLEGEDIWDETARLLQPLLPAGVDVHSYPQPIYACKEHKKVHVIAPDSSPSAHVLYLGLPRFIPFALQLPALKHWAKVLRVKIWAITEDSIDSEKLKPGASASEFQDELTNLVSALLPVLGERFILVDSTWGSGTFLAWWLRDRLSGALIFNVHLFMAPDFEGTEPAKKIKNRMAKLGEFFENKDMDSIMGVLPDFMYPTGGADGVEATKQAYAAAVSSASEKFWKLSALQPSWNFNHLTPILSSQSEWQMDSLPVVLACSDQAPLVVVGESMQRLNHLMPGSKLEFIPSSKWSWQLEGEEVLESVTELLDSLLPTHLSDKHMGKRSLPLLGQQVIIPPSIDGDEHDPFCRSCDRTCRADQPLCPVQ